MSTPTTAPLPMPTPSVDFAALFASLPESDPDRHDFDPLDEPFAHLAPGYPVEAVAS
jgi:hypothetical protein